MRSALLFLLLPTLALAQSPTPHPEALGTVTGHITCADILSVEQAKDVGPVEVANPPGSNPTTHIEHRTLHTYGTLEQPLTVQTDIQSLILTVPNKPTTTSTE
jgi:hypothetical protein